MKRRIFTAVLAAAMILSLAACGGKNGGTSSNPGSSSGSGTSSSQPDGSNPDGSQPDASNPDSSVPSGSGSNGDLQPIPTITITPNKTSVKLTKAGATFQLRYTLEPETDAKVTFTSGNDKVITVNSEGVITAVAPGKTNVSLQCDNASTVTVAVECDWKAETKPEEKPKPDPKPDGSGGSSSGGDSSSTPASNVDLSAFYTTITGKYEFGMLELADASLMDQFYAGMSDVSAEQKLIYITMMSMNNGEFGLVQVKDSKDVDTVKAIFQARIDYMVGDGNGPGGAWYPGPTEQWQNNSRVVTNGNYVMMVVHENCDDIVNEFNALF